MGKIISVIVAVIVAIVLVVAYKIGIGLDYGKVLNNLSFSSNLCGKEDITCCYCQHQLMNQKTDVSSDTKNQENVICYNALVCWTAIVIVLTICFTFVFCFIMNYLLRYIIKKMK